MLFSSLVEALNLREDVSVTALGTGGVRGRGIAGAVAFLRLARNVDRELKAVDVATLHVSTTGLHLMALLFSRLARLRGVPLVIRKFGGTDFLDYGLLRRACILLGLRSADLYLAETKALVERARVAGVASARWYPNSRAMPDLPDVDERRGRSCTRFVFLGQVHSGKGVRELIRAGERLPKGTIVDVYGTLDFDIGQHEFAGLRRVRYMGAVRPKDVHDTLSGYDALVLPSYHEGEGYPGVVLEAYAAGLPVVSTRWRAIPELVEEGKTGLLVEPGDSEHLRRALQSLIDDPALCERLRAGVRGKREEFASTVWHGRFVDQCRAVVEKARASIDAPGPQARRGGRDGL